MKLFAGKSVRRNVTIDEHVAGTLSVLSQISGLSQGDLIEMGLRQPFMHKLMVFASDSTDSPIAEVMDLYQSAGEKHMTKEITSGFVRVLLEDILSKPLRFCMQPDVLSGLNAYIYEHIRHKNVELLPGFCELSNLSSRGLFVMHETEADFSRSVANVKAYLIAMQRNMDKPEVYANDFLMRILVVLFRDFIIGVAEPSDALEQKAYYYKCCAGVLSSMFPVSNQVFSGT